jgi:serine/threonine-protein kinase
MSGRRAEAVTAFERAMELDPRSAEIHLRAASNLLRLQRIAEAEKHIATALELAPNHWEPWLHRGTLLYFTGNYPEAASAFEKSCSIAPDNYASQRSLGAAYVSLNRSDDAKAAFQRSLEARPTPSALSNLGTLLYYEQQYEKAVDAFRHAIKIDANKMDLWANLGDAWRFVPGHREDALDAYRHALRTGRNELARSPNDVALRCLMAATLAKSGSMDEARHVLKGLAGSKIVQPDHLLLQAVALELTGQRGPALRTLAAAVAAGLPAARVESEPEFLGLRRDPDYHNLKLYAREPAAAARR